MTERRRLERPWMVEETSTTFVVRTANRLVVSLIYFDNEPLCVPKTGSELMR